MRMTMDLQEKQRRRAGTDGDPPRLMFKGLNGRYAGGGMPARDRALYVGGGVAGTGVLFLLVYWMITLF